MQLSDFIICMTFIEINGILMQNVTDQIADLLGIIKQPIILKDKY